MRVGSKHSPLALIVLLTGLSACAATDVPSSANHPPSLAPQALPEVEEGGAFWDELVRISAYPEPSVDLCRDALQHGEAWWLDLRDRAQILFHDRVAEDEATIRTWTVERRLFFERWLGTPSPVLVLRDGEFQVSASTEETFRAWSRCADDANSAVLWQERAGRR